MPQHQSAIKRVRQNKKRREHNRAQRKKMRELVKNVLESDNKEEADKLFKEAQSYLDRVARRGLIHKNKAAHKKSRMRKHINTL